MKLTAAWLNKHFECRNGRLYRKVRIGGPTRAGQEVKGGVTAHGYPCTFIGGKRYTIHRLVFLMKRGYLPAMLDHKDRNRKNNRIENLRPATKHLNNFNLSKRKNNTSGTPGVYYYKPLGLWEGRVYFKGASFFLGRWATKSTAVKKVESFRRKKMRELIAEEKETRKSRKHI